MRTESGDDPHRCLYRRKKEIRTSLRPVLAEARRAAGAFGGGSSLPPSGAQPQQAEEENPLRCDVCGETYQEFQKTGRLGCAHCYAAFGEQLEKTLKSIHGHAHHVGKVPPYLEGEVRTERELDELRRQMDQAVQDEEFEQAARLRDRIRELTREQNADSGSADQKEGNADAGE